MQDSDHREFDETETPDVEVNLRHFLDSRCRPLAIGVVAFLMVLVLRHFGLLDGLFAVGVSSLCFFFAPGPRRVSDRFILAFAICVGWFPTLGWIPHLGVTVDVPGIALAVAVGATCAHQFRPSRASRHRAALFNIAEVTSLLAGGAVTLWWALPFGRLSTSGILNFLTWGWDNNTHFSIFRSNLQLGSFIQANPTLPGGASRLGYDYPQGLHQAWAQYARLLNPHQTLTLTYLLHSYVDVLLLTVGAIVTLGCMAISRIAKGDLLASLPAMAVIIAVYGIGRYGPFTGIPNYELSIVAAAVAVTMLVRPTMSPITNFVAVAGLGLVVAYNWYPLLLLASPAVVRASLRAQHELSGRKFQVMWGVIVATAALYLLPVTSFAHRGVSFLDAFGGHPISWGLMIFSIVTLLAITVFRQLVHKDLKTNLVVGASAILGGVAVTIVVVYEKVSVGSISYYGNKVADGVCGVCLTILICVLASDLSASKFRHKIPMTAMSSGAILLAIASLQINGYIGPSMNSLEHFQRAPGLQTYGVLKIVAPTPAWSWQLLNSARIAQQYRDRNPKEQWWYLNPTSIGPGYGGFSLPAEWFVILRGNPTNDEYYRSGETLGYQFASANTESQAASLVIADFPNPIANHIHVLVPKWLRNEIILKDPIWSRPSQLVSIPLT